MPFPQVEWRPPLPTSPHWFGNRSKESRFPQILPNILRALSFYFISLGFSPPIPIFFSFFSSIRKMYTIPEQSKGVCGVYFLFRWLQQTKRQRERPSSPRVFLFWRKKRKSGKRKKNPGTYLLSHLKKGCALYHLNCVFLFLFLIFFFFFVSRNSGYFLIWILDPTFFRGFSYFFPVFFFS